MNKPLSVPARRDLRQRMIEDMNVRSFSAKTQHDYLRIVSRFAAFLGRSPDLATPEDIRRFQIEQREAGMPAPAMNGSNDNSQVATRTVRTVTSPLDKIAGLIGDKAHVDG